MAEYAVSGPMRSAIGLGAVLSMDIVTHMECH